MGLSALPDQGSAAAREAAEAVVVDYRHVNARTRRSAYYVRPAVGMVAEAAGSIWLTHLDAGTGFNHIVNTPRARRVVAIF